MKDEVEKYLAKILESNEFKDSSKYQNLLEYLVNSSLSGTIPKEITIALDVFNIEYSHSSKGESNIRVYVYNLRKKLELYYAEEGKDDHLRFVISKGAYKVNFVKNKNYHWLSNVRWKILFGITVLLLLVNIIWGIFQIGFKNENHIHSKFVWKNIVNSELPVLVVVGDYYLVKDTSFADRVRYVRDSRINSDDDYAEFRNEYPNQNFNFDKINHTLLGKFAPYCINELSNFFALHHKKVEIIMASDFQWHDINNKNIIYVGSFKSLGTLNNLLKNSDFKFYAFPNELQFKELKSDSVFHYHSFDSNVNNALESDYAVVAKFQLTNKTDILFFVSTRDIGLMSMVSYFTGEESLTRFENEHIKSSADNYFESCFKIMGLQRTIKSIELLHVNNTVRTNLNPE